MRLERDKVFPSIYKVTCAIPISELDGTVKEVRYIIDKIGGLELVTTREDALKYLLRSVDIRISMYKTNSLSKQNAVGLRNKIADEIEKERKGDEHPNKTE